MTKNKKRRTEPEVEKPTFEALLQEDPAYQEAFDQKVNQALLSARTRWERERSYEPDEEERLEEIRAREAESIQLSREREAGLRPPADGDGCGSGASEAGTGLRLRALAGRWDPGGVGGEHRHL